MKSGFYILILTYVYSLPEIKAPKIKPI